MRTAVEDHGAIQDELRSAHEEMLSATEEFQSTNEELETSKEERQSTRRTAVRDACNCWSSDKPPRVEEPIAAPQRPYSTLPARTVRCAVRIRNFESSSVARSASQVSESRPNRHCACGAVRRRPGISRYSARTRRNSSSDATFTHGPASHNGLPFAMNLPRTRWERPSIRTESCAARRGGRV